MYKCNDSEIENEKKEMHQNTEIIVPKNQNGFKGILQLQSSVKSLNRRALYKRIW